MSDDPISLLDHFSHDEQTFGWCRSRVEEVSIFQPTHLILAHWSMQAQPSKPTKIYSWKTNPTIKYPRFMLYVHGRWDQAFLECRDNALIVIPMKLKKM